MDSAMPLLLVLAVVGGAMTLIGWLSGRTTRDVQHGDTRVQDRAHRRWGFVYADPADERVWVPRPMGNGWDPNLATLGGKLIYVAFGLLVLAVLGALLSDLVR